MLERIDKHSVISKSDWIEFVVVLVILSVLIGIVLYYFMSLCSQIIEFVEVLEEVIIN